MFNFLLTKHKSGKFCDRYKESVTLLCIEIDFKLKFESHVNNLCVKAGGQLNSLFRFKNFMSLDSKKLSVNSFILSNFSYCPLVWHFSNKTSSNKIESIQKRAHKFLNSDLNNSSKLHSTMEIKRFRTLAIEIYKTLNGLNPTYMRDIFNIPMNRTSKRLTNLESKRFKSVKFGRNSLRILGPILWNSLPANVKNLSSLNHFKRFIQNWGTSNCPHLKKFYSYISSIK